MRIRLWIVALAWLSCFRTVPASAADWLNDIRPLLREKCFACHGALRQQSGLRLDTASAVHRGGDLGPAVRPGSPDDSHLIQVLTGSAGFRMPPEGEGTPLTDEEVALIVAWIASGAAIPENEEPETDPRAWWSYQPLRRPDLPTPADPAWCRAPIDWFIAARRDAVGLTPAVEAPREAWLRRVYLDLIGLPPSRSELHAFLADTSPQAAEKVVDDLLARPQYGERWGRHWMDIWRYSDWYGSRGINEIRYSQRHIWRWRDWIVDSLNADKGYDRMVMEMLAADELAPADTAVLPATGYLGRNWYKFDRNVWMFDTVERTGEAFLGLTLRCCRCHDHKFDPVTQKEYYRFRAFFEPHDVRTDPFSALTPTEKDATLGPVLTDGIARVYDKDAAVVTYRFMRGDNRFPDESEPLTPGVPAALGPLESAIEPVDLPPEAWYPALRPGMTESLIQQARTAIETAQAAHSRTAQQVSDLAARITALEAAPENTPTTDTASSDAATTETTAASPSETDPEGAVFLHDDFKAARPDIWETQGGDWVYEDGHLIQKAVTSFATLVTKQPHPTDFQVHVRYRPLAPGMYRSVGFSFDFQDKGSSQDVYTSTGDAKQSVQAFHRTGGQQHYPQAGIVPVTLAVGAETTLDVTVKGSRLSITLNGEPRLDYPLPIERRAGRFALWVHSGSAEFLELVIRGIPESIETLRQNLADARHELALAALHVEIAQAEAVSVQARLDAEHDTHTRLWQQRKTAAATAPSSSQPAATEITEPAREASRAERAVAALRARLDVLKATHALDRFLVVPADTPERLKTGTDLRAALTDAQSKLDQAVAAVEAPDGTYTTFGDTFPATSTGRRLALARWIASPENPRTARVAVNHIWNRHFGRPLVTTTENFGLNGTTPTHPELLDWLASELIASGWRMKPVHRVIVLSSTYRQSARATEPPGGGPSPDPENLWLARMNPHRMEAEVVRDSVLSLAGQLDETRGGPEIPEKDGDKVPRRSLYFRNTPNEKMPFLEVFDVADPNACYRRRESVVPHQALALMNSGLAQDHARAIAARLTPQAGTDTEFVIAAFETILTRQPSSLEGERCLSFLAAASESETAGAAFPGGGTSAIAPSADAHTRARENLVHVLLLHNDFVTIR